MIKLSLRRMDYISEEILINRSLFQSDNHSPEYQFGRTGGDLLILSQVDIKECLYIDK